VINEAETQRNTGPLVPACLDSWKEIALYLGREVRTCQRWEKFEGLPVHRLQHSKMSSVYAIPGELDEWRHRRSLGGRKIEEQAPVPASEIENEKRSPSVLRYGLALLIAFITCLGLFRHFRHSSEGESYPVVLPLTTLNGEQTSPSLSPDGKSVAFAWGSEEDLRYSVCTKIVAGGQPNCFARSNETEFSPTYSPDGDWIAYLGGPRSEKAEVYLRPLRGGPVRALAELPWGAWPGHHLLAWMPNGRAIVAAGPSSLFLISVPSGEERQLTDPSDGDTDRFPTISSDGRDLVFTRFHRGVANLYRQHLDKAELPAPIPSPEGKVPNHICASWRPGRKELIAALSSGSVSEIWRIPLDGRPALVLRLPSGIADLAVSPDDRSLIYVEDRPDVNLWTVDLKNPQPRSMRSDELSSTRDEFNPQYSPDGTQVAFESNRSGFSEIWIANRDGQRAKQITSFEGPITGSPYWSPDGNWLTFDSRPNGKPTIFIVPSGGGAPVAVTSKDGPNVVPSWSHDGKWIYFGSSRTGVMQVWRVRPDGKDESQITKRGGFAAIDGVDSKFVYYTKSRQMNGGLWRVSLATGAEEQVLARAYDRLFAVTVSSIYLATEDRGATVLARWPFGAARSTSMIPLTKPLYFGLAIRPDEREAMYGQLDARTKQLMRLNPLPQ